VAAYNPGNEQRLRMRLKRREDALKSILDGAFVTPQ
jgi:hypothetical protein